MVRRKVQAEKNDESDHDNQSSSSTTISKSAVDAKKRVKDMSAEERKEYERQRKKEYRARKNKKEDTDTHTGEIGNSHDSEFDPSVPSTSTSTSKSLQAMKPENRREHPTQQTPSHPKEGGGNETGTSKKTTTKTPLQKNEAARLRMKSVRDKKKADRSTTPSEDTSNVDAVFQVPQTPKLPKRGSSNFQIKSKKLRFTDDSIFGDDEMDDLSISSKTDNRKRKTPECVTDSASDGACDQSSDMPQSETPVSRRRRTSKRVDLDVSSPSGVSSRSPTPVLRRGQRLRNVIQKTPTTQPSSASSRNSTPSVVTPKNATIKDATVKRFDCKIRFAYISLFELETQSIVVPYFEEKSAVKKRSVHYQFSRLSEQKFHEIENKHDAIKKRTDPDEFDPIVIDAGKLPQHLGILVKSPVTSLLRKFTVKTEAQLRAIYFSILQKCDATGIVSVGIPLLGAGYGGISPSRSFLIGLQSILHYFSVVENTTIQLVYIAVRDAERYENLGSMISYYREFDLSHTSAKTWRKRIEDYMDQLKFTKKNGRLHKSYCRFPGTDAVLRCIKTKATTRDKVECSKIHRTMTHRTQVKKVPYVTTEKVDYDATIEANQFIVPYKCHDSEDLYHGTFNGHYLQPSASARRQCGTYNVLRKLWIISVYAMYYSEPADETARNFSQCSEGNREERKRLFMSYYKMHKKVVRAWRHMVINVPVRCKCSKLNGNHENYFVFKTTISHTDEIFDEWLLKNMSTGIDENRMMKNWKNLNDDSCFIPSGTHTVMSENNKELEKLIESKFYEFFSKRHEMLADSSRNVRAMFEKLGIIDDKTMNFETGNELLGETTSDDEEDDLYLDDPEHLKILQDLHEKVEDLQYDVIKKYSDWYRRFVQNTVIREKQWRNRLFRKKDEYYFGDALLWYKENGDLMAIDEYIRSAKSIHAVGEVSSPSNASEISNQWGRSSSDEQVDGPDMWEHHNLGPRDDCCDYCGAIGFRGEKQRKCCKRGMIWISPMKKVPACVEKVFDKHKKNVLNINTAHSMASLNYDRQPQAPHGVQAVKVRGQVSFMPSAILPRNPENPKFANLFVIDRSNDEIAEIRMKQLAKNNKKLKKLFCELQEYFAEHNAFAALYKNMEELKEEAKKEGKAEEKLRFRIVPVDELQRFDLNAKHPGVYANPNRMGKNYISIAYTSDVNSEALPRGMTVFLKNPQNIQIFPMNVYDDKCDPLCYPLFFPNGETGYGYQKYARCDDRQNVRTYDERKKMETEKIEERGENPDDYFDLPKTPSVVSPNGSDAEKMSNSDSSKHDQNKKTRKMVDSSDSDDNETLSPDASKRREKKPRKISSSDSDSSDLSSDGDEFDIDRVLRNDDEEQLQDMIRPQGTRPRIGTREHGGELYPVREGNEVIPFVLTDMGAADEVQPTEENIGDEMEFENDVNCLNPQNHSMQEFEGSDNERTRAVTGRRNKNMEKLEEYRQKVDVIFEKYRGCTGSMELRGYKVEMNQLFGETCGYEYHEQEDFESVRNQRYRAYHGLPKKPREDKELEELQKFSTEDSFPYAEHRLLSERHLKEVLEMNRSRQLFLRPYVPISQEKLNNMRKRLTDESDTEEAGKTNDSFNTVIETADIDDQHECEERMRTIFQDLRQMKQTANSPENSSPTQRDSSEENQLIDITKSNRISEVPEENESSSDDNDEFAEERENQYRLLDELRQECRGSNGSSKLTNALPISSKPKVKKHAPSESSLSEQESGMSEKSENSTDDNDEDAKLTNALPVSGRPKVKKTVPSESDSETSDTESSDSEKSDTEKSPEKAEERRDDTEKSPEKAEERRDDTEKSPEKAEERRDDTCPFNTETFAEYSLRLDKKLEEAHKKNVEAAKAEAKAEEMKNQKKRRRQKRVVDDDVSEEEMMGFSPVRRDSSGNEEELDIGLSENMHQEKLDEPRKSDDADGDDDEELMDDIENDNVFPGDVDRSEPTVLARSNGGVPQSKNVKNVGKREFVSAAEYYTFQLKSRTEIPNRFMEKSGKLGQLYTCAAYSKISEMRMDAIASKRAEYSQGLNKSALFEHLSSKISDKLKSELGMLVTVPSKVPGSPKYMRELVMSAVHLSNELGHPDLFITFTGNPSWEEIKGSIPPNCDWADCPDLVVSTFWNKASQFLEDVLGKEKRDRKDGGKMKREPGLFGDVLWYTYSVEFQQRGMPHIHLLVSLKDHIKDAKKIDEFVAAELPPEPDSNDPDYENKMRYRKLVITSMLHSPCEGDRTAYCNLGKKKSTWKRCTKDFPKSFSDSTIFGDNAYPTYKRTKNSTHTFYRNGKRMVADSSYVVAHNPELLTKYGCHINVEVVTSIKMMKYMFKYVFKGVDRAIVEVCESVGFDKNGKVIGGQEHTSMVGSLLGAPHVSKASIEKRQRTVAKMMTDNNVNPKDDKGNWKVAINECYSYQDYRAVTAIEALWRIQGRPIHGSSHVVHRAFVHQEGDEMIMFKRGEAHKAYKQNEKYGPRTMLTAWFDANKNPQALPDGRSTLDLTYDEMFKFYRYDCVEKKFVLRKKDHSRRILARVQSPQPRFLELMAVRLLALNTKGPTSFAELRTYNGVEYETCLDAAIARRLMNNEKEWMCALAEVGRHASPKDCRRFYANILVACAPANAKQLFEMNKDIFLNNNRWSEEQKVAHALRHIRFLLRSHGMDLVDFQIEDLFDEADLPIITPAEDDDNPEGNVLSPQEHQDQADKMYGKLNLDQKSVVDFAVEQVRQRREDRKENMLFINGPGGTGKTFCYTTMFHMMMALGKKVLCVAHTGIAATLLPQGCTTHRMFHIPLELDNQLTCKIDLAGNEAITLRSYDVVIWDEACMSDRRIVDAVNNLFMDIHNFTDQPFGGTVVIMGGDWRQILPIVEGVRNEGVLDYTIKKSTIWPKVREFKLSINQRAADDPDFADFILAVGDGSNYWNEKRKMIQLPANMVCRGDRSQLIDFVFGDMSDMESVKKSAILTLDNKTAIEINDHILQKLPGQGRTYYSTDQPDEMNGIMADPQVFANQTPSGMPPHKMNLKVGAQVVLLRNQNVRAGLCNGTRLTVHELGEDLIICTPNTKNDYTPEKVFFHRQWMTQSGKNAQQTGFKRLQFPIRLAYACTVNKSQGQTLDRAGVILHNNCFTHGQLYVALSRVRASDKIQVCHFKRGTKDDYLSGGDIAIRNIVYKDAFK